MNGLTASALTAKITAYAVSVFVGVALFAAIIRIAGLENILGSVRKFSPIYAVPFLLATLAHFVAATYRWKVLLASEGAKISIWTLLKHKLIVFSVNYFTPAARLGGEPLKIFLLKRRGVKSSKTLASVVVDNFVGMGIDALVAGFALLALFFAAGVGRQVRELSFLLGVTSLAAVGGSYLLLIKRKGIFSNLMLLAGKATGLKKKKAFALVFRRIRTAEKYTRTMLIKKPKVLLKSVLFAAMSWPLTIVQYKFALLMLGVDASIVQIVFSIVALSFTSMLPVPAALGVQEAGQFSAFKMFSANPHAGVALSLVLRAKDLLLVLLSFILLSREGVNLFRILDKRGIESRRKRK